MSTEPVDLTPFIVPGSARLTRTPAALTTPSAPVRLDWTINLTFKPDPTLFAWFRAVILLDRERLVRRTWSVTRRRQRGHR